MTFRRSYEEALRMCASDVELTTLYDVPGRPGFRGPDGLREWYDRLDNLWALMVMRDAEIEERDGGWVLMRVEARLRGRASRTEFEAQIAVAIQVIDGKVARLGIFPAESNALAMIAAG